MKNDTRLAHARDVLRLEADAVRAQIDQLGAPFLAACDLLLATRGHIIVTLHYRQIYTATGGDRMASCGRRSAGRR